MTATQYPPTQQQPLPHGMPEHRPHQGTGEPPTYPGYGPPGTPPRFGQHYPPNQGHTAPYSGMPPVAAPPPRPSKGGWIIGISIALAFFLALGSIAGAVVYTQRSGGTDPVSQAARAASGGGGGDMIPFEIATLGLTASIPAGWTKQTVSNMTVFTSADSLAQVMIIASSHPMAGRTAEDLVNQHLFATYSAYKLDPDVVNATGKTMSFGGQTGYGTNTYTYSALSDAMTVDRFDRAVILSGRAEYYFAFTVEESVASKYASTMASIEKSVKITGP